MCTTRFTIAHLNYPRTNYNRCRDHADPDLPLGFSENTLSSAGHTSPSGHGILEQQSAGHDRPVTTRGHDRTVVNTCFGVADRRLLPMQLYPPLQSHTAFRGRSHQQQSITAGTKTSYEATFRPSGAATTPITTFPSGFLRTHYRPLDTPPHPVTGFLKRVTTVRETHLWGSRTGASSRCSSGKASPSTRGCDAYPTTRLRASSCQMLTDSSQVDMMGLLDSADPTRECWSPLQGYLAHKKQPPLGPPYDPRYSPTVGS